MLVLFYRSKYAGKIKVGYLQWKGKSVSTLVSEIEIKERSLEYEDVNAKIAHLQMIQNIICRMAKNSFFYKGITLTIFSFISTLHFNLYKTHMNNIVVVIVIAVVWLLDAYHLQQERLFRALFEKHRLKFDTDFSMKIAEFKKEVAVLSLRYCFPEPFCFFM